MMDEGDKKKWAIKLTVLGDAAVGKTSLINKYITNSFKEKYQPTLGVNIVTKDIQIQEDNSEIQFLLWDILGQDKYELTRQMFFQGCAGTLLVYDMTRYSTFERVKTKWIEDFKKYGKPDSVYLLIGNKSDLKDSIKASSEEGKLLADKIEAVEFLETSAKYGENVEKAFRILFSHVLEKSGVKIDLE